MPKSGPAYTPGTDEMRNRLASEILEFIEAGPDSPVPEDVFNDYSIQMFEHHYAANPLFHEYCENRGVRPGSIDRWEDVPVVWSDAFKTHLVASFPPEKAVMAVMTGGTTSLTQRGRIFRDELGQKLVLTANRVLTHHYLFPDFPEGARCRVLIMAPGTAVAPSMGMAIGMDQTKENFGTEDSLFLLKKSGIDVKALIQALRESEESGVPVALVGATASYVYFFKACERKGLTFKLPPKSRVCDGGGYRGRFGPMTRDDYYELVQGILGVSSDWCVNVLGEGETASNYFDDTLRRTVLGLPKRERIKPAHPWSRVRCVSTEDLSTLPDGKIGLVQIFDLANVPTVLAVMSDDLGWTKFGGVEMVGRAMVENGRVVQMPDEPPAGMMGDAPVFRLLENYINFSIDFKMLGTKAETPPNAPPEVVEAAPKKPRVSDVLGQGEAKVADQIEDLLEATADEELADFKPETPATPPEAAPGIAPGFWEEVDHAQEDAVPGCPQVVDELLMAGHEADAAEMAEQALAAFREQADRPLSVYQEEWEKQGKKGEPPAEGNEEQVDK
jgi:hypothetical protein